LTPRHPSHALDDLIASTECRGQMAFAGPDGSVGSRPHLHDGASGVAVSVPHRLQSPRCSYLGAMKFLRTGLAKRAVSSRFSRVEVAQFSRHFARYLTCQRSLSACPKTIRRCTADQLRRGKDSDFENPVNALARFITVFSSLQVLRPLTCGTGGLSVTPGAAADRFAESIHKDLIPATRSAPPELVKR
jgi:hypothetical protein